MKIEIEMKMQIKMNMNMSIKMERKIEMMTIRSIIEMAIQKQSVQDD